MRIDELTGLAESEKSARMSLAERVALLPPPLRTAFLESLSRDEKLLLLAHWEGEGRPGQLRPDGDWRIWMIMGGRGYGKTRAGAQWMLALARTPKSRLALVGPTEDEVRSVMVEGSSGILASASDDERPAWEPSLGRLTWANGTQAFVRSGANPEALRGPEHDHAWCDELAKWARAEASWDNLMFGLRRGALPRVLVTTTPRPTPLMRRLAGRGDVALTRGRTADAALLAPRVVDYLTELYGGTRFGRQELDGELIEDVEGSLWPRDLIERCRAPSPPRAQHGEGDQVKPGGGVEGPEPEGSSETFEDRCQLPLHHIACGPPPHPAMGRIYRRVVIGVDPPVSAEGDACGIVVCVLGSNGIAYVVDDASVSGASPEGWARAVAGAAHKWGADRVVAEGNQGGAMVASVLRAADVGLPVRMVHASIGKSARAEPVAALFERGAAKFAGAFPALEDELAGLIAGGGYEGPGRSPDRADAMVWAMTELMLGQKRAEPRIRRL
ncbi:MAG: DNA-packaging protein [Allosphingosinicella sp.]